MTVYTRCGCNVPSLPFVSLYHAQWYQGGTVDGREYNGSITDRYHTIYNCLIALSLTNCPFHKIFADWNPQIFTMASLCRPNAANIKATFCTHTQTPNPPCPLTPKTHLKAHHHTSTPPSTSHPPPPPCHRTSNHSPT